MARPTKRTNSTVKKVVEAPIKKVQTEEPVTVKEPIVEETVAEAKPAKRVFASDELITCKSIAPGGTYIVGSKSGTLYTFEYEGAEIGIEYNDLKTMVNTKSSYLFRPFIVVMDDDFVNAFPKLKEFYDSQYSLRNLEEILDLPSGDMKRAIETLPVGAKDAIKGLVVSKIADGTYDPSTTQIKALDQALGTQIRVIADI